MTQEIQSLCTRRSFKVIRFLCSLLIKTHILIRPCDADLDVKNTDAAISQIRSQWEREEAHVPTRPSFSGRSTAFMASVPLLKRHSPPAAAGGTSQSDVIVMMPTCQRGSRTSEEWIHLLKKQVGSVVNLWLWMGPIRWFCCGCGCLKITQFKIVFFEI